MIDKLLKPKQALKKAFLKVKPIRTEIESFKTNLIKLIDQTNEFESEEFHKNLVIDFLKKTYYDPKHYVNTKGKNDLVIHLEEKAKSPVVVIIEAKKPTNKSEMLKTTNINYKAFQELVLYYLRERITNNNLELKHLIVTNIHEWFIFDALTFDRHFAQNKTLVKQFEDFERGRLSEIKTDFFYKNIAEPAIENVKDQIEFTYFDIRTYDKPLRNADQKDDHKLISLFKLLSPEHLLKLPFANDSNSLDKRFYSELLHILGLTETKEGGKKLIGRSRKEDRNSGSILEDAIIQLDSLDKIGQLDKPSQYGNTNEERLFNVGLELSITWINRILFLKLLEAQLITYHKGDKSYAFLNKKNIHDWDEMNSLFFQVLAKRLDERNEDVRNAFAKVPYLNSSLFEPTDMEQKTIMINFLKNEKTIPVISSTVLKNDQGKKLTGSLTTLDYLFKFLDAYDFASEGSEEIQEDNKTLINASVLGLIFEKINGYKDGSFFTPGFITMYMCRETIRRAVIQKFKKEKGWEVETIDQLYDKIEDRTEANELVNSIKICDPAVGSGHFLVSALNEIIAVKNDLKILQDRSGKRLKEYRVEVENDELIVTDEDGELFEYNPTNRESHRIQETLFHEKQTIIENCLFGVDINPNSVKICRLRLWIELLKSAYYKSSDELETLPNIDINIKCGNSLVSRFALDSDLKSALKGSWKIEDYKVAVSSYRNAKSKDQKKAMEVLIFQIKSNFRTSIGKTSKEQIALDRLGYELFKLTGKGRDGTSIMLFDEAELKNVDRKKEKERVEKIAKIESDIEKYSNTIREVKESKIYENAFEWRFEFPEVLNDSGDFIGFDVLIGNPPYIRIQELQNNSPEFVKYLNEKFESAGKGNYDIYIPFIELGYNILRKEGALAYIMPHKFLNANYGAEIRGFLKKTNFPEKIIHFGSLQVFEDATTYTGLFFMSKKLNLTISYFDCDSPSKILEYNDIDFSPVDLSTLNKENWIFLKKEDNLILEKIKQHQNNLEDLTDRIFQGLKTSADKIFIVKKMSESESNYLVFSEQLEKELELEKTFLFPIIKGGNSRAYTLSEPELLILFPYKDGYLVPFDSLRQQAPLIAEYLVANKSYLEKRESGKFKGENWFQYGRHQAIEVIKTRKIFTPDIAPSSRFAFDTTGRYMFTGGASGGYGIIPKSGISFNFLLGILNSRIANWYISITSTQMRGGWYSFESRYIKSIPFPSQLSSNEIDDAVEQLIKQKGENMELINKIDQLVYVLYGLSEEEIEIVENT